MAHLFAKNLRFALNVCGIHFAQSLGFSSTCTQTRKSCNNKFNKFKMIFKLNKKGFLLVEFLIAAGIFTLVLVLAAGIFTSGLNTQKEIYNIYYLQSEGNFFMQKISKEIRMLKNINSNQENSNGSSLEFRNYNLETITYCQSDSLGTCAVNGNFLARNGKVMNSPEIIMESVKFYTSEDFSSTKPLITVVLKMKSAVYPLKSLTLQNSLVSRSYPN